MLRMLMVSSLMLLAACTGMPEGVQPVKGFDINRYTGTWYEIARLDHSFERGMRNVTAEYSLNDDGSVKVVNRGYKEEQEWSEAEGKAKFVESPDVGHLKVSFFGPFYGSYVIFDLDQENYNYAAISGPDTSYLWLLSRTPTVSDAVKEQFLTKAANAGFDTDALIFVSHAPLEK